MVLPVANAALAYAKALSNAASGGGIGGDAAGGTSFADLLSGAAKQAVASTKQSEKASFGALSKSTELTDVVAAVNNAEITLDTVVAVRDRVINAYQDIIKMPI